MSLEYSPGEKLIGLRDNYARLAFIGSAHETPMVTQPTETALIETYYLESYLTSSLTRRAQLHAIRPHWKGKIEQRVRDVFTLSHCTAKTFSELFSAWFENVYDVDNLDDQRTSEAAMVGMGFVMDAQFLEKGKDFFIRIDTIDEERLGQIFRRVTIPERSKRPFATADMCTTPQMIKPFPDGQIALNRLLPPLSWIVSDTLRQQEALIDGATSIFHVLTDIEDELHA